jgi:hypothetical protein
VEAILRVALSNTLLAAVLALAAMAVSRIFRRPAVSHALWLIVLLKLITPPLWNVAVPLIPAEKSHKAPLPPTELSIRRRRKRSRCVSRRWKRKWRSGGQCPPYKQEIREVDAWIIVVAPAAAS